MKYKEKKGFTVLEMVISMSMVVLVTALFIANYRTTEKRTDLIMTAQKLVADIHQAQNNSLGLVKYSSGVPAGGWGVNFSTTNNDQYTIFADLDSSGPGYMVMDAGENTVDYGARIISLPDNIEISAIRVGGVVATSGVVTFLPPDPKTNIYDGTSTSTTMDIELKETRNDSIKTIRVNFLGLAEAID